MKNAIIELLKGYALKAMTGLVGWRLQLAKFALNKILPYAGQAYDYIEKKLIIWAGEHKIEKQKQIDDKNAGKYEEALKDGVSEDQLDDATSSLLNGRKH